MISSYLFSKNNILDSFTVSFFCHGCTLRIPVLNLLFDYYKFIIIISLTREKNSGGS